MQRSLKITTIADLNQAISNNRLGQKDKDQNSDPQSADIPSNEEWHFLLSFRSPADDFVTTIQTAIRNMALIAPLPTLVFKNMSMPVSANFQFNNTYETAKQNAQQANLSNNHKTLLTNLGFTVHTVSSSGAKRSLSEAMEDEEIHKDFKRMCF